MIKGVSWKKEKLEKEVEEFIKEHRGKNRGKEGMGDKDERKQEDGDSGDTQLGEKERNYEEKKDLERGIIIEDDLTWKEREIQQKLRKMAREEKEKGMKAKVGYMKISINEKWYRWNEEREELEEENAGKRE